METKKIAIACFVGALIGTAVALSVAPLFWWLGMLTGFGAGYLCYDLKEVREKAPIAWKATVKRGPIVLNWLKKPHPFLCLNLVIDVLVIRFLWWLFLDTGPVAEGHRVGGIALSLFFSFLACLFILAIIIKLTEESSKKEKCYWVSSFFCIGGIEGYRKIQVTYWNVYRLLLKGLFTVVLWPALRFIFYKVWASLFRGIWTLICFAAKLFKLIHSHKRVLCGIDSAIGVALTYILLGTKAVTPGQQLMVVICGGIIGAVIGVLNYEIISKRLLHLAPATNNG